MRRQCFSTLVVILSICLNAFSQQLPKTAKPAAAGVETGIETERDMNVLFVKELANRVSQFQSIRLDKQVDALSDLGDLLWGYDPIFARQLFGRALDLLKSEEGSQASSLPSSETQKRRLDGVRLMSARARVIGRLAKHDPFGSKALLETLTPRPSSSVESRSISLRIEEKNAGTPNPSSRSRVGVAQGRVRFLTALRAKDAERAHAQFLQALGELVSQSDVDANELLTLGVFVFLPPASSGPVLFPEITIDNAQTVNLSAEGQGINPNLVRAYLGAAAKILIRPIADPTQKQLYYIACYQLLAKANRFSPELAPSFSGAMQRLTPDVSRTLDVATKETLSNPEGASDVDAEFTRIEKLRFSSERDEKYLDFVFQAYQKGNFPLARRASKKLQDLAIQRRLSTILDFGEIAQLIGQGKIDTAESLMKDANDVESAMLGLGIARAHAEKHSRERSLRWINKALEVSRRLDDPRRPFLTLAAAELLANYDVPAAISVFGETVQEFNRRNTSAGAETMDWAATVDAGDKTIRFRLELKGLSLGRFSDPLRIIAKAEPEATKNMVLGLKNEEIQSLAISGLARSLLPRAR